MSLHPSATASDRSQLYKALNRRNRFIGWLRILVPAAGVVVFLVLLVQIVIANIARDIGFDGVRIVRDELVIDTPEYSGVMANGTRYTVRADAASTALSGTDIIALQRAEVDLLRVDGYAMHATANQAQFRLAEQKVDVEGLMVVTDSYGMRAQLLDSTIDWPTQTLVARDNVHIVFGDGSVLTGSALHYDAGAETWDFDFVKLTVPMTEEAEQ